ncbi:unnamed protein product [Mytilus edulis]|uniref:VWFA domain-containing protein n=1 Tax=Mytilus edulis TaxID=6550 RepID=A0A8S3V2X6_MYTED|nr:unnamed protein product [Mytilus edulis]
MNVSVYKDFGFPNRTLMAIAGTSVDTCQDCDNSGTNENSCNNNLLVSDMLTSGYQTGQDVQPPYKTNDNFDQGKCGFGGSTDTENGFRTAKGGINKDRLDSKYSPHHHLHYKAFYAARRATEQFLVDQDIGIINDMKADTFVQIFGLGKRYQASFGFVIDDTGSMGDEIEEVRKACIDIITNVFGTPNAPSNYILVTFNDPVKHMHRLTTSNGLEMISALGNLTVEGGDDCPEYAMSGLEKAIELCQEQSTIFFYTDAPAKDEAERDTVMNAAEEKQIDLQLFVQNETCGPLRKRRATKRTKRDVESHVYSQVAEGTGGAIYRFNTSLLGELMIQISEELFPSATAIVDTFELKDGETNPISFPVDSMLNNVKITVIGATSAADVNIESPLGSIMTAVTTSVYFESPDKVVVTVLNPTPAQTSVDFHYLITEEAEDGYFYRISGKPIEGKQYRIYLTVYDLPVGMDASGVRLETNGSPTNNLDISEVAGDFGTTYFVSTTLSYDLYKISMYGTDNSGNTWMRTSPYLITPTTVRLKVISTPDLYMNTVSTVSYTVENKGFESETFVVEVTDDRGLLTGQTSFTQLITSNGSTEIICQLQGSSLYNTVTYTITVRKLGSVNILMEESQTIYISQEFPPSCSVQTLVEICDDLGNTSCSEVTWNGKAAISFTTELSSIAGSKGLIFDTSSEYSSPININVRSRLLSVLLPDSKINPSDVFGDLKCDVSNKPPIATTLQQPLDIEDLDLE